MAQRYVVKNEDNPLTLSKKFATSATTILAANGIKTLTPGQTIRIPSTNGPFPVNRNPLLNPTISAANVHPPPAPVYSSGSFISGAGQVYRPPVQTTGGMLSPEKNVVTGRPVLPTGSFVSGSGGANLQGQSAGTTVAPAAAARPTGTYADNPAAWRAYWNASATAGRDVAASAAPAPVHIPTRAEIWNIKANQRRRRAAEAADGSTGDGYWSGDRQTGHWVSNTPAVSPIAPIDPTLQNLGSAVNTALSWWVG